MSNLLFVNLQSQINNFIVVKVGNTIVTSVDIQNQIILNLIVNKQELTQLNIDKNKNFSVQSLIRKSIKNDPDTNNMYNKYLKLKKLTDDIKKLEKSLSSTNNFIENQTYFLLDILYEMRYVDLSNSFLSRDTSDNPVISDYIVSLKGVIAAQINECNSLLLSEIIMYDVNQDSDLMLSGLTAEEIVAVLAIFIIDANPDDRLIFSDIEATPNVLDRITKIKKIIEHMQSIEDEFNFGNEDYWDISFNLVDAVYAWASGSTFLNALSLIGGERAAVGGGGFIKHMRKINNLVSDLISSCQVCNNIKLLPELHKVEQLIMRNEVTTASLYIE